MKKSYTTKNNISHSKFMILHIKYIAKYLIKVIKRKYQKNIKKFTLSRINNCKICS